MIVKKNSDNWLIIDKLIINNALKKLLRSSVYVEGAVLFRIL